MYKRCTLCISILSILISSCSSGNSSEQINTQPDKLVINHSEFLSDIFSYDLLELNISSNYTSCSFDIASPYIYWKKSLGNTFTFNAPITLIEKETFSISVNSISSDTCPAGQKNIDILVNRFNTQYSVSPANIADLHTDFYHVTDIGFGGLKITERYSSIICYPTPEDCITYENQLFGQDAHNMATGDFNNDGFEDLVVAWAIFPHTIEESQKIDAPINIYLNDGKGHLYEDKSIYYSGINPTHPFPYRLAIADFNGDGVDDIFSGSMGKAVRFEDYSQNYTKEYPHLLLLSDDGKFKDMSANIEDKNNGEGQKCVFAHDASTGDFDADGDFDIYACNLLLVNDGIGNFSISKYINLEWYQTHMSPMSSLVDDLNNDGFDDLIFWNFDNRYLFDARPEEGIILLSNNSPDISTWAKIDLPKGPFDINHNKYNHAASGDLNGDGYKDIVVVITRDEPYYEGAYIQVLINDQTGMLTDETSARFVNQERLEKHHGEGNIYLKDIDGDGDLDIFHSTRDFEASTSGAHIAINDGQGNFISNELILPSRPLSNSGWSSTGGLMKGVPIDLDKKGCLDLISTSDSWSNESESNNYLFSILNTDCSF